ncbi:MAG: carboxy terminal-processing peptidase [Bacteriovoracaceae bacterium]|nr:carboxy terminal-processing peptidase [Bacteriovoracaceae bacterium]
MKSLIILLSLLLAWSATADVNKLKRKELSQSEKTRIITAMIRTALENYHYKGKKVDDDISKLAYKQFIKRLDYGKQFFLKEDVVKLNKFELSIDDEIKSGELFLLDQAVTILKKRILEVQQLHKVLFKNNFNFNKKESIETDPEKRKYSKNSKMLKDHWRKVFKQSTVSRYLSLIEDQEEEVKESKEKKSKKSKKKKSKKDSLIGLSKKKLQKKAHAAIDKKYKKFFERMLKDGYYDYLDKYINSLTTAFDPHTNYFPPRKKEDFDIEMSGSLEGIGAVLQEDSPYIKVVEIVAGGAAWRQKGLEVDDLILAVAQADGEPVDLVDMRVDNAVRYIRGKKGTEVRLTVKKPDGSRKVIPIIRDVVETGAGFAKSSVISSKSLGLKVGYIKLPKFYRDFEKSNGRNCTKDVRKELVDLKKRDVDAIILDLRNNGGGALEDAKQMSGLFIKKGPIVQVRDGRNQLEIYEDRDSTVVYDGPLIVMVNRLSASASEILAGAMQDYGRAIIVGSEFTHGKGTVQQVLDLNRGTILSLLGPTVGALKITLQKFYRVTGASTQYKGVTPDIFLPDLFSYDKNREQDLDNSLPWDEIKGLKITPWRGHNYDMSKLKKRSASRVKKSSRFQQINRNIEILKKRRNDTLVSLHISDILKEQEVGKKLSKQIKIEEKNEDIVVTDFLTALKFDNKKKKADMELWKKDYAKREKEWIENLQKDPGLEEALNIVDDMLKMEKKVSLR